MFTKLYRNKSLIIKIILFLVIVNLYIKNVELQDMLEETANRVDGLEDRFKRLESDTEDKIRDLEYKIIDLEYR